MPVLGDDFQEGGDGPFDVLPMIGTVIALLATGMMMALASDGNGNAGSTVENGGGGGDSSGENLALSDDVVEETQDELVSAEEGRLDSTPPEQRPKRPRAPRQIHSVAHEDIIGDNVVFFHIDLEHTGPKGAICQLSVVYMDANLNVIGESDWYIKPPDDAEWDEHACAPHGLKPTSPVIMEAKSIEDVWPEFKQEVEAKLEGGKVGMFLAWNGKGSDLTKLFEVTEVLYRGQLYMPEGVKYFADPMNAIKGYKKNAFNEKNRTRNQPDGYGLGVVYELMFQKRLKNAHNSIVDARAQAEIFKHPEVQKTFDLTQNVILMDEVWKGKKVKRVEQAAELTRSVPMGWSTELEPFEIPPSRRYTGASGGGQLGPTSQVKTVCAERNLAALFCLFFTDPILDLIARETNRYGNEDWVRPVSEEDYRRHYERQNDSTADEPSEDERVEKRPRRDATAKFMAKADDFDDYEGYDSDDDEDYSPEDRHFKPDLAFDNLSVDEVSVSDSADSDDDSDYVPYEDEEDLIGYFEDEADDESIDATDQEVDGLSDADYSDDELDAFDYCAEPEKKSRFIECPRGHPTARHRYKVAGSPWVEVTRGYLLCYFGIIILIAA
ncbi:hypothetical protein THAOC_15253 [Thalassiosira oceanica]|uniref:Uncharacterized protein n=1 Tax=Thalassiosira oceanica TaxID=159749 RepID=K0SGD2_THAOC|nr:hypothetical protein THAOC_15253 [Thalassiosira oceanica]|eukprot:EJK64049.1 hypothetical protein THAOC_15253 [Thalassiosira oceanica]